MKSSGMLSSGSSVLRMVCPLMPMLASTLYSAEVKVPTVSTNVWRCSLLISSGVKLWERALRVVPRPIFLLRMT